MRGHDDGDTIEAAGEAGVSPAIACCSMSLSGSSLQRCPRETAACASSIPVHVATLDMVAQAGVEGGDVHAPALGHFIESDLRIALAADQYDLVARAGVRVAGVQ
jgi:hypothetical protein